MRKPHLGGLPNGATDELIDARDFPIANGELALENFALSSYFISRFIPPWRIPPPQPLSNHVAASSTENAPRGVLAA